jgi:hypothetical protein
MKPADPVATPADHGFLNRHSEFTQHTKYPKKEKEKEHVL